MSVVNEVDTNYIAKRGYLGIFGSLSAASDTLAGAFTSAILTGSSIDAVTGMPEERPAYKTRDHDSNAKELLKFVVSCEINEISEAANESSGQNMSEELLTLSAEHLSISIRVFLNSLRCYGHKLGNASELTEQPDVLNSLVESMEGLLLWAHVISIALHALQTHSPSASIVTEPLLNAACSALMAGVCKQWTQQCTFAQDVAYLRLIEILLATYTPLIREEKVAASGLTLPNVLHGNGSPPIFRRCLWKMAAALSSSHFKVALRAIESLQNSEILARYVLPTARPNRFVYVQQQTRVKFTRHLSAEMRYTVGTPTNLREAMLEMLVDALRANRTHWHPAVQTSSAAALDTLFHRIEEAEDLMDAQGCLERSPDSPTADEDADGGNFLL